MRMCLSGPRRTHGCWSYRESSHLPHEFFARHRCLHLDEICQDLRTGSGPYSFGINDVFYPEDKTLQCTFFLPSIFFRVMKAFSRTLWWSSCFMVSPNCVVIATYLGVGALKKWRRHPRDILDWFVFPSEHRYLQFLLVHS